MRLDIAYRLHFTYSAPVAESQNEVRVRPLDDVRQQVLSYRLTTTPATRVLQTRDYFGTTVDHLGIRSPHDDLLVVAEASVETATTAAAHVPVTGERLREQTFINQHFEYLTPSQHVQWGDLVDEVASWAVRDAADDVYEQVLAVVRAVPTVLSYRRGSTAIGVTLEELIDGGAGVCQDFAHLAVGMLRCIGVPARYVSGYLFALDETRLDEGSHDTEPHDARLAGERPDGDLRSGRERATAGAGGDARAESGAAVGDQSAARRPKSADPTAISVQTHAWIEAAVPGSGWLGLDPTNGGSVGERHVVIGHGRDYHDVPPVRGVFNGTAEAKVDAEVIIAQPSAPVSMVTEPIRRQTRVAVNAAPEVPTQQAAHQHQQQQQQ